MISNLIQIEGADCPFPYFNGEQVYKIYNDGSNYVATCCFQTRPNPNRMPRKPRELTVSKKQVNLTVTQRETIFRGVMRAKRKLVDENGEKLDKTRVDKMRLKPYRFETTGREAIDILFDSLYYHAFKTGLRDGKLETPMTDYIRTGILKLYPDFEDIDEFIADKIKRKLNNLIHRKKRFRRKAYLNEWNYFVTFTYDDKKHTEESFRKKLRKCLSNLHTRRGWKYMGVFENAPDTGRLHFHGLVYVPDGEMIETIYEREDYSTAQKKMQITYPNTFFEEAFGRNDFEELSKMSLKYTGTLDYILKYIGKTNERIVYSRGIPTEIYKKLTDKEIITKFTDFVEKFVLFDNVVDWERDIKHYKYRKQMTITDLLCNPPKSA